MPVCARLAGRILLPLLAAILVSCGGQGLAPARPTESGAVVIRHSQLRGVPPSVDQFRVTGLDANGVVVFGPILVTVDDELQLNGLPPTVVTLTIEYLDLDRPEQVVGISRITVRIAAGMLALVQNPSIDLLVADTTLTVTIVPGQPSDKGYVRLGYGPGWPTILRTDLGATAQAGRETRRQTLACIAQISDVHMVDAESPLRVEYLRGEKGNEIVKQQDFQGAFRAQETLTTHVANAMVQQLNDLSLGPITGRPIDCMVSTGDNGDNRQANEAGWFISVLDGGLIRPSSGDPDGYEGVQDQSPNPFFETYYHPDQNVQDIYKSIYGFPDYPGMLKACTTPFQAEGSRYPWYTVYGNHDDLVLGNLPTREDRDPKNALDSIVTGTRKNLAMPPTYSDDVLGFMVDFFNLFGLWPQFIARENAQRMLAASTPHRQVTADPGRHLLSPQQWAQAHFDSPSTPGPVGHGLQADSPTTGALYYTFQVAPGVLGITLDTVNRTGYADGSLDQAQFGWLRDQLISASSRYYDESGNLISTSNPDQLIVLFSHHNLKTMENPLTETDPRVLSADIKKLLQRFPNVVLWCNGHSHFCRVWAHPDPSGRTGGFWEVNTPSHVDFPQQSRIIEMVSNQDGTLSIFATLVDHQAPPATDPGQLDPLGLASVSRELSANDNLVNRAEHLGLETDRNVELVIQAPFTP